VSISSTFFARFFVRKSFLAAFSSYVMALAKKYVQKTRMFNVDEIDDGTLTASQTYLSHISFSKNIYNLLSIL